MLHFSKGIHIYTNNKESKMIDYTVVSIFNFSNTVLISESLVSVKEGVSLSRDCCSCALSASSSNEWRLMFCAISLACTSGSLVSVFVT